MQTAAQFRLLQELRGVRSNRTFHLMKTRFACGSMVLLYLFHKKIHVVNFFVKKIWVLPPCRRLNYASGSGTA
jgi:hypothetical protein